MSKEKTPIEELINQIEQMVANGGDADLLAAIINAKMLLPKEREAIEEAFTNGWKTGRGYDDGGAKQYYNDKYGKNIQITGS